MVATNNTIDGNYRGVVVRGRATRLDLSNSLVTNHVLAGVHVSDRAVPVLRFNDVFNSGVSEGNYKGVIDPTGSEGNVSADPLYVDRANRDFRLQAGSPAIDAGSSDGAPADDLDFNWRVDNAAVPNSGAGTSPFYDLGAYEYGGRPRQAKHSPTGDVAGLVSNAVLTFRGAMDTGSFDPVADVVSFVGPNGSIQINDYRWRNAYQLEILFPTQARAGVYELTVGPHILDAGGNAMDQDGDGLRAEIPDDRYAARWTIVPPRVVGHLPQDFVAGTVERMKFTFDRPMDPSSFTLADDLARLTGPLGDIPPTGLSWTAPDTLEISFASQTALGVYQAVLGPDIRDIGGNLIDQNRDAVFSQVPGDQYRGEFTLAEMVHVSGLIEQNTTWGGLVIVEDTVTVKAGVKLTINPGSIVKLADATAIVVASGADLEASGTIAQPIRVTSIHDDTVGGDSNRNGRPHSTGGRRLARSVSRWRSVPTESRFPELRRRHGQRQLGHVGRCRVGPERREGRADGQHDCGLSLRGRNFLGQHQPGPDYQQRDRRVRSRHQCGRPGQSAEQHAGRQPHRHLGARRQAGDDELDRQQQSRKRRTQHPVNGHDDPLQQRLVERWAELPFAGESDRQQWKPVGGSAVR